MILNNYNFPKVRGYTSLESVLYSPTHLGKLQSVRIGFYYTGQLIVT